MRKILILILLISCNDSNDKPENGDEHQNLNQKIDSVYYKCDINSNTIVVCDLSYPCSDIFSIDISKYLKNENYIFRNSLNKWKIGRIVNVFRNSMKIDEIIIWYETIEEKTYLTGVAFLFKDKESDYFELCFGLDSNSHIIEEKICCIDDKKLSTTNWKQRALEKILNCGYKCIGQISTKPLIRRKK